MLILTFEIIIKLLNLHPSLLKLSQVILKQMLYFIYNHQTRYNFHIVENDILGLVASPWNIHSLYKTILPSLQQFWEYQLFIAKVTVSETQTAKESS